MQFAPFTPSRLPLRLPDIIVGLALAALLYLAIQLALGAPDQLAGPAISLEPAALPYYGLRSLLRMAAAYVLSLAFALLYGYTIAKSRRAETVLLPVLDVLQSVPILSFLPIVVLTLVAIAPRDIGLELAAVILIFTSMAWNITFAFYQSVITVPKEMMEAASVFRFNPWLRFRSVELSFATIALVFNSILSWAGGWFFLMAAEQFVLGQRNFQLLGIGSYLKTAAELGDISALLLGLVTLVVIIVALDQLLWRPAIAWADKFKLQTVEEAEPPRSWVLDLLSRSELVERLNNRVVAPLSERVDRTMGRLTSATSATTGGVIGKALGALGTLAVAATIGAALYGSVLAIGLISELGLQEWLLILVAASATFLRVVAALVLALAWTLPLGVAIGTNPRLASRLLPAVQIAASVPATALFPILLLVLIGLAGGLDIAAVLLMLLGTQWYLLFNIIAGAAAIPEDLKYTTESLGIRGFERWRSFILPAIFPYLITGLITATGGAWNASIVAEYVTFAGEVQQTLGLGALIAASSEAGDFALLLASTLAMIAIVVMINHFFWRRLYRVAGARFRLE